MEEPPVSVETTDGAAAEDVEKSLIPEDPHVEPKPAEKDRPTGPESPPPNECANDAPTELTDPTKITSGSNSTNDQLEEVPAPEDNVNVEHASSGLVGDLQEQSTEPSTSDELGGLVKSLEPSVGATTEEEPEAPSTELGADDRDKELKVDTSTNQPEDPFDETLERPKLGRQFGQQFQLGGRATGIYGHQLGCQRCPQD